MVASDLMRTDKRSLTPRRSFDIAITQRFSQGHLLVRVSCLAAPLLLVLLRIADRTSISDEVC